MTVPSQRFKVLTIIDTLVLGGAERVAVETAGALDRARFAPHLLVTRTGGPLEAVAEETQLPYTILGRTRKLSPRAVVRARRVAAGADIVHAHGFGSNVWGAALATSLRRPFVAHVHKGSEERPRLERALYRYLIARAAGQVLCVSDAVRRSLERDGIRGNLLHFPNAVRTDDILPREQARQALGLPQDAYVIGTVGALRPEKAHRVLFEAASEVDADSSFVVCVVGAGPEEPTLRKLVSSLGLDERVVWAGARSDAPKLQSAFDVAVTSSTWEGLPLSVLEAMAAGVPVVASAVGGLPALLAGGGGVLVRPGDARELADALRNLRSSPERAATMGHDGRRIVEESYGFEQLVTRLEGIYVDAITSRGAPLRTQLLGSTGRTSGSRPRTPR